MPVLTAALPALLMKFALVASVTPAPPVIAAPAAIVRLPVPACIVTAPEPVTDAFRLIALSASSVRLAFALVQLIAELTLISPAPGVCTPAPVAPDAVVCSTTLVPPFSVVEISLAAVASMVRSVGSTSHVPARPNGAAAVMCVSGAILKRAAEVSIEPPWPPFGALASNVPPTFTEPASMPPSNTILPSCSCTVCARILPVLFTALASSASLAPAVMMTWPPSATSSCRFSARLSSVLASTCR
ncbi:hypothetical protein QFZ99_003839 [Paraburkholderia atlantica]